MPIKTKADNYFLLGIECVRIGPEFDSRYQLNYHYLVFLDLVFR